jgi:aspartyl protease family protein
LKFRDFQQVKCLKDNSKNYYLIISDFIYKNGYVISYSQTMIDNDLKVINVSKIPINDGLSELVENENIEKTTNSIVMKKKNGVYYIPVEVNGYSMEFVFDTGASSVSISLTEAMLLYKNGKLSKSDILGSQYFSDANGDISEGTKINIRIIKIGNKILQNVEATVVHNLEAPLLLGQSALNKFGKFYVNTANNTITFE